LDQRTEWISNQKSKSEPESESKPPPLFSEKPKEKNEEKSKEKSKEKTDEEIQEELIKEFQEKHAEKPVEEEKPIRHIGPNPRLHPLRKKSRYKKIGSLSNKDKKFITDNVHVMKVPEIARALNRREIPIYRFIDEKVFDSLYL